jgi:hypothetical protein
MALQDLNGKRTGRPRGAKTSSRVRRDLMWVYRNLHTDAKPPSPGARLWLELARTNPGEFLRCVLEADRRATRTPSSQPTDPNEVLSAARRVRKLFVPWNHLVQYLAGGRAPSVSNLPGCFACLSAAYDPARQGLVLTIESGAFSPAPAGQEIPEFPSLFASAPR